MSNNKTLHQTLQHTLSRSYLRLGNSTNTSQIDEGPDTNNAGKTDLKLKPRSKQLADMLEFANDKTLNQSTLGNYKLDGNLSEKTTQNSMNEQIDASSTNYIKSSSTVSTTNLRTHKIMGHRPVSPNVASTKSSAVISRKELNTSLLRQASENEENGKTETEISESTVLTSSVPKLRTKQLSLIYPNETVAASHQFTKKNTVPGLSLNDSFGNSPQYSLQNSKTYGKSTVNLAPLSNAQAGSGQPAGNIFEAFPGKTESINHKHRRYFTLTGGNSGLKGLFEPIQNTNAMDQSKANGYGSLNTSSNGIEKELILPNNTKKVLNTSAEKITPLPNGKPAFDEQFEAKIETFLSKKKADLSHLKELSYIFEAVIANASEFTTHQEIQKHQSVLSKIKYAYEFFFQTYARARKEKELAEKEKDSREKEELTLENRQLKAQLKALNEELQVAREHSHQGKQNELSSPLFIRTPTSSEVIPTNKKSVGDCYDSPPTTINPSHFDRERENLRSMIMTQQNTINSLKRKEAKLIRLLYACKRQGLDLEKVYNEDMKNGFDQADSHQISHTEESDLPTLNKNAHLNKSGLKHYNHTESDNHTLDMQHTSDSVLETVTGRDLKEQPVDSQAYGQEESNPKQHLGLPAALKNKLKLDFTSLQNNTASGKSQQKQFGLKEFLQAQIQKQAPQQEQQSKPLKLSIPTLKINGQISKDERILEASSAE